jgi:hypothetical protein
MVNHQAKAKKELNAELKGHAGHSDHLAPSEILGHDMTHGMGQMNLHENRAVDTQLAMPRRGSGALSDQMTRDQVLAKSELNAEIKNHAGENILPSEISGSQMQPGLQDTQFMQADQFKQNDQWKQGNQGESNDQWRQDQFKQASWDKQNDQFKQNDQWNKQADWDKQNDQLKQSATNDAVARDHILAKKDLNAEIKEAAGSGLSDHIMPSAISHKQGEQFQHDRPQGEELAGFATDDAMKDHIMAKKELNAEIKEHAGADKMLPSDISSTTFHDGRSNIPPNDIKNDRLKGEMEYSQAKDTDLEGRRQSIGEMIKAKVTNAATAVKNLL